MKVVLAGSSGLVGTRLKQFLVQQNVDYSALVRRNPESGEIQWKPQAGEIDAGKLEGVDAVVNLAGDNIAEGRWTDAKKDRILHSRTNTTLLLSQTLSELSAKPRVLVNASAIGYYGDRGDDEMREDSPAGKGFLSSVCEQWEAATQAAQDVGIRVVRLRIGVVLSKDGGALSKMLLPFRMGGGGIVGNGRQYWSWITLDDLAAVIHHCLVSEGLSGAVNAVSPQPVTNAEFTKTLGKVLSRPTLVPLPAFAAKMMLGEMAEELILASTRVIPQKLLDDGYPFKHADLESALRAEL